MRMRCAHAHRNALEKAVFAFAQERSMMRRRCAVLWYPGRYAAVLAMLC
jgi:hypothetical protein